MVTVDWVDVDVDRKDFCDGDGDDGYNVGGYAVGEGLVPNYS